MRRGTGDVVDDGRDELRVDRESHAGSGLLDDAAQLLGGERRGQDDARPGTRGESGMLGEPVQVVAANDGDDPGHAPAVQQLEDILEEGGSGGRRAGGPHLLQLIHDEQAGRTDGLPRDCALPACSRAA